MSNSDKVVYIVHCVDTEGPLHEPLEATSERLRNTFDINVDLTQEKLEQMKKGLLVPDHLSKQVKDFLSRCDYNDCWGKLDEMLKELFSEEWRSRYNDDFGQGYIFNWFVIDHVGFVSNPRRRALGYHAVYDFYRAKLEHYKNTKDKIYWHYHPTSYFFEAHKTSNNFSFTNEHLNVLSRRIIDHLDFPVAYRPGSHVERPDINFFLEQWIPFDYGNQGMKERKDDNLQADLSGGRYGDWRRAPSEWGVYNPDFYDYQKKEDMRRYIARCLNLDSRVRPITKDEIEKAFLQAHGNQPVILSVTNHDEREMREGIEWFMDTVRVVQADSFPNTKIRHVNAVDAIRLVEGMEKQPPLEFKFYWDGNKLNISSDKDCWGIQPYFCFKTKDQRYIHENLDVQGEKEWSFIFDENFIALDQIEYIGFAAHDRVGNTSVCRLTPDQDLTNLVCCYLNNDWPESL